MGQLQEREDRGFLVLLRSRKNFIEGLGEFRASRG